MPELDLNIHYYNLLEGLKAEREEELVQHRQFMESLPLKERIETGYCIQPIILNEIGFTLGNRATIILDLKKPIPSHSPIQSGRPVVIYEVISSGKRNEIRGTLHAVSPVQIKIYLSSKEHPEWLETSTLGIEVDFDERTFKLMEMALNNAINDPKKSLERWKNIFQAHVVPDFTQRVSEPLPSLNSSQNNAIQHIACADELAIVHGPPGTGKTTTLIGAIKNSLITEQQVLVCGPSNISVDVIVERLAKEGISVVRIGNLSRMDESLLEHSLDARVETHPEFTHIRKIKLEAAQLRREAGQYKRKATHDLTRERQRLRKEAKDLDAWAIELEERIINSVIESSSVVATTLSSYANSELYKRRFKTLFIDEASQAHEALCWLVLPYITKMVLFGDPLQLSPTVKSYKAEKLGFGKTLLENCIDQGVPSTLLRIQYRMHNAIMQFSNEWFYKGKLINAESIAEQKQLNETLVFIDTAGTGFQEETELKKGSKFGSKYNPGEWNILREHILLLNSNEELKGNGITIITPYRAQTVYIRDAIRSENELKKLTINVSTIDGFQGQENDIVIISLVRSNDTGEIGFLKEYRRLNVAMTRAKIHLAIIGDSGTLGEDQFYRKLIEYVELNGCYKSAYEYMQ